MKRCSLSLENFGKYLVTVDLRGYLPSESVCFVRGVKVRFNAKPQIGIQLKIEKNVMNGLFMYVVLWAQRKVCIECILQLVQNNFILRLV